MGQGVGGGGSARHRDPLKEIGEKKINALVVQDVKIVTKEYQVDVPKYVQTEQVKYNRLNSNRSSTMRLREILSSTMSSRKRQSSSHQEKKTPSSSSQKKSKSSVQSTSTSRMSAPLSRVWSMPWRL